ncbi:RidA family protein [Nocardiopsis suaedae]|uniref:RidA family protein n=1 Tax=Nocardiopsis suaedae TaxID=3018444 RepID=A0ABT4TEI0_9ACTN|nr:RidA family protein [Nocardiopsis suaedae]MDA2803087.1 RidA family protein [Nocardiopsis suaedae]
MRAELADPAGAPPPSGPYSQVARVPLGAAGTLLMVSGQVAVAPDGPVTAPGDMAAQSEAVLDAIEALVRAEGGTLADVLNVRTFVTDMDALPAYAAARSRRFPGTPPTSTTVAVSALFTPGAVIEAEAVAVIPARAARPDAPAAE